MHASVQRAALRGYAASKAGLMGLTRELAGVVGPQGHPRQRDRARLLPLAARRRRDRDAEAAIKATQPDSARRRRRRAQRRRGVPRRRRLQLHHRPDHRRRWRTDHRVSTPSPYASRPWQQHYDYWVRPHMSYPGRPLYDILALTAVTGPIARRRVSRRRADLSRCQARADGSRRGWRIWGSRRAIASA